jgi:hypothetical protein
MVVRASNGMPVLDKDYTRSPVVRRDVLISNVICNWSAHNPSVILLQHPTYEEQSARARSAALPETSIRNTGLNKLSCMHHKHHFWVVECFHPQALRCGPF